MKSKHRPRKPRDINIWIGTFNIIGRGVSFKYDFEASWVDLNDCIKLRDWLTRYIAWAEAKRGK